MSATLERRWLASIDFAEYVEQLSELRLGDDDKSMPSLMQRYTAKKGFSKTDCLSDNPENVARLTLKKHQPGTLTIVVVNTVKRAMAIYAALAKIKTRPELTLLHSRFRPPDRATALARLLAPPKKEGMICVATQVIEAGVDISAATLITDPAPWSSLVQRFGRCNRYGEYKKAQVLLLALDLEKRDIALPYDSQQLQDALALLEGVNDVGPAGLPAVEMPFEHLTVLRHKDLIDLFDTTPDISGMDIDVSRYIREDNDHDVQVFWRNVPDLDKAREAVAPASNELCSVSISEIRNAKHVSPLLWDYLDKTWARVRPLELMPGMVLMLNQADGCYSSLAGWTGKKTDIPELLEPAQQLPEANDDDRLAVATWQSLKEHTGAVLYHLQPLYIDLENNLKDPLLLAAKWHDAGKAHDVFQRALLGEPPKKPESITWAKAESSARYARKGFRHELASALAMLQNGLPDLAAYLAAAHHGKVRLSIRSLPHEQPPNDPALRFARGIWDGDTLRQTELCTGLVMQECRLNLAFMELGEGPAGPSWLARMLALRDDKALGPFRLAYLEAVMRAADWRASKDAGAIRE